MRLTQLPVPYLLREAQQINKLRWVFAGITTITLLILAPWLNAFWISLTVLAAGLALAGTFEILYRRLQKTYLRTPQSVGKRLGIYFRAQVFLEVILIAVIIHISGGALSPLSMLYIFYISMLAVVFPTRQMILLNLYIILVYAGLMEAYHAGFIQPITPIDSALFGLPTWIYTRPFIRIVQISFTSAFVLSGIVVAARARQLHFSWAESVQKNNSLDHLNELIRQGLTPTDLTSLCQAMVNQIGIIMDADGIYINAWDESTHSTLPMAAYGPQQDTYRQTATPQNAKTVTEAMRRIGGPLTIDNVHDTPHIHPDIAALYLTHSLLALPIYGYPEKNYWGALLIGYNQPHKFDTEEIHQAQQISDILALLISRARLYQETGTRAELLSEFSRQVTKLTSDLRHTTLLPAIVESACGLLKAQRAALFLRRSSEKSLECSHMIGLSQEYVQGINQHSRPALEEAVFDENVILVPDVTREPALRNLTEIIRQEGFRAYGVFALQSEDGPRGALAVYWDHVHAISSEEIAMARLFAERAGDVLHNADLYAQVTEQSLTDGLTNLPNRRSLDKQLQEESSRAFRSGRPFTLVMMDLDSFKAINDTYGHPMGDSVLQQVATNLRRSVRTTDFVSRYGGDEFAIILPETDMTAAGTVVEKLRMALASCDLHLPNTTQRFISASMGLAVFPGDTGVPDKLLEIADRRLYKAKHTRSGQIVTSG